MELRERLEFDTRDSKRIYKYIERNGPTKPDQVEDSLQVDPKTFTHELALLKRDGYLEEREGTLHVALDAGEKEEYTSEDISYTIRPGRQEDLSGIVGAIRQVTKEKTDLVAESVAEQVDYEGTLIRNNTAGARMFFVATVEDAVVGWAHLETPTIEKLDHTAELTVGVLEEYRRHGMGSHLLHRSLEWAAASGCQKVYNSIPATNQAAAEFLETHGWETEAIRRNHYRIDDEFVAELMMAKHL